MTTKTFLAILCTLMVTVSGQSLATMADSYSSFSQWRTSIGTNATVPTIGWNPVTARVRNGFVIVWLTPMTGEDESLHELQVLGHNENNWSDEEVVTLCKIRPRAPPTVSGVYDTNQVSISYQVGGTVVTTFLTVGYNGVLTVVANHCVDDDAYTSKYYHIASAASSSGKVLVAETNIMPSLQSEGIHIHHHTPDGGRVFAEIPGIPRFQYSFQTQADMAFLKNGNLVVVWQHSFSLVILGCVMDPEAGALLKSFRADEGNEVGGVWFPSLLMKNTGTGFFVLWKEDAELYANKSPEPAIWMREFMEDGSFDEANPLPVLMTQSEQSVGTGFVPSAIIKADDSAVAIAWLEGRTLYVDAFSTAHDGSFGARTPGYEAEVSVMYGFPNVTRPSMVHLGDLSDNRLGFFVAGSFTIREPFFTAARFEAFL